MLLLFCDLDGTLIGDYPNPSLPFLRKWLAAEKNDILIIPSTGRGPDNMLRALKDHQFSLNSAAICSAGTEIVWGSALRPDDEWTESLVQNWPRKDIKNALASLDCIVPQNEGDQGPGKLGYVIHKSIAKNALTAVKETLEKENLPADVSFCESFFMDVLAPGGNKGAAVTFLAKKFGESVSDVITIGNSANDLSMLTLDCRSIAIGQSGELEPLQGRRDVFWANEPLAGGIIEGLRYWGVL